ncbi:MAG: DUF2709 domain-containing protein [Chlamydiales bacterium]|nr:DUF2709 domain-containing protein [Chlamydiales bacterium]
MAELTLSDSLITSLKKFLKSNRKAELVNAYLFYVGEKYKVKPVAFPKGKIIFQSLDSAVDILEKENKLWRETQIKVHFDRESVNEDTARVYICPFSGKVFGDNTHPNPQDAIYDWVAKCPENTERVNGLPAKRFLVSEDKEVIKNYIKERKKAVTKTVFSSAVNGKLFNSKKAVVEDFEQNYVKSMTLLEVQNQNRFQIEDGFLNFIQEQLDEQKITSFVETLSNHADFLPFVEKWLSSDEEE